MGRKSKEQEIGYWDKPVNRKRKQDAFRTYITGVPISHVMKVMKSNVVTIRRFIHSEKWDEHKKIWLENPDKENLYPWDAEKPSKLALPPAHMNRMDKDERLDCIRAFSLYCSGRSIADISREMDIKLHKLTLWKSTQRWQVCRERLVNEGSPAPWEDDDVPITMQDITASLEAMNKSIKFLTGKSLIKAATAIQDLDGMETFGMMKNAL